MEKSTCKYELIFMKILNEDIGVSSALGGTAAGFSGDNITSSDFYAPGDSRIPSSIFGGVLTRRGISKKKRKRKSRARRRERKS